jgi:hypothetical protein
MQVAYVDKAGAHEGRVVVVPEKCRGRSLGKTVEGHLEFPRRYKGEPCRVPEHGREVARKGDKIICHAERARALARGLDKGQIREGSLYKQACKNDSRYNSDLFHYQLLGFL